jgi:fatty acid desaturase
MLTAMRERSQISALFTRDEIRVLAAASDAAGWWAVVSIWAVILATFAALALVPTGWMFALAVFILGGRQLALAILMHEASHYTLFRTRRLNDFAGDWLGGRYIWLDVKRYRVHHTLHHAKTGTEGDPDASLVRPFPATRASVARKLARDLTGLSVFRRILGHVLMDLGVLKFTVAGDAVRVPRNGRSVWAYVREGATNLTPVVLANGLLAGGLWLAGCLWVYAAWAVAYATTFSFYLRIRSMAEHACTERSPDMLRNTRSTRAGWLARATVAPLNVNYHIEHHVLPAIPYFRLREAHRLLREKGVVPASPGYGDVLRMVSAG